MKKKEDLNFYNRLASIFLLILPLGLVGFSIFKIFMMQPSGIVLNIIALIATALFCIFEIIIISIGKKKDSSLQRIVFNENGTVNAFPLIVVSVASAIATSLLFLGIYLFFTRAEIDTKSTLLVLTSIGFYLFINCLIYYIYLIMFRKREFKLKDLIK